MSKNKTNPFVGLSNIKAEEHAGASALDLLRIVEDLAPSYQQGQTRDMFLFLYFIDILVKAGVDFLLQGGILLSTALGEHCRRTYDIDVIVKDPDAFYDDVRKAISSCMSDLYFDVAYVKKKEASERYYKNTFSFRVTCYHGEEVVGMIIVDGVYTDDYESMHKVVYKGPEIIDKDFRFYGVDIEYVAREKILALSSELPRPIKHLVDVYSLTKIDLDIEKLRRYLDEGLARENHIRESFGKPLLAKDYAVKDGKKFLGNYVYEMISSGYPLRFKEMKESVNAWIQATLSA